MKTWCPWCGEEGFFNWREILRCMNKRQLGYYISTKLRCVCGFITTHPLEDVNLAALADHVKTCARYQEECTLQLISRVGDDD